VFVTAARGGQDGRGEVQLFDGTTGERLQELYPPHPPKLGQLSTGNQFGAAVAADGERVLIGTPGDDRRPPYFGAAHLYDRCGNGIRVAGEECDDGNGEDGDGCSSTCRLEVCGSTPRSGCIAAGRASLLLFDPYVVYNTQAKLKWSFRSSSGGFGDFGDPLTSAGYVLCVYANQPPVLQMAALAGGTCNGGPCWTLKGTSYRYRGDDSNLPDGDLDLRLSSRGGTTKLKLSGLGENLAIPDRSCPECPIPYTGTMTAQLVNTESGTCWSSSFPSYKNRSGRLTGKH
jgi:cysteine-rich repeat protein